MFTLSCLYTTSMRFLVLSFFCLLQVISLVCAQSQQLIHPLDTVTFLKTPPQPQSSGWVQIPTGTMNPVNSLSFPTRDTAFAWGDTPIRSIDGGLTWQRFNMPVSMVFQFIDSQNGYTAGYTTHTAYHTSDAGQHWDSADDGGQLIRSICPVSRDTAFLSGSIWISRTTNAGKTWTAKALGITNIEAIAFGDSRHGMVVGDVTEGPVRGQNAAGCYTTSDGGVTWIQQFTTAPEPFLSVAAIDTNRYVAVGANCEIYRTVDQGRTWSQIPFATSGLPFDAISIVGKTGLIVGEKGTILYSSDTGNSWIQQSCPVSSDLSSVKLYDETLALAAGRSGVILRTTTAGRSSVNLSQAPIWLAIRSYPEPFHSTTTLSYVLPSVEHVSVSIFDISGRLIENLLQSELQNAGPHSVIIDGNSQPSGTYTYQFGSEHYSASGRITLVK